MVHPIYHLVCRIITRGIPPFLVAKKPHVHALVLLQHVDSILEVKNYVPVKNVKRLHVHVSNCCHLEGTRSIRSRQFTVDLDLHVYMYNYIYIIYYK